MAPNRIKQRHQLGASGTWVQVPLSKTGKLGVVRTVANTDKASLIEVALSVAAPAGAGVTLPVGEATEYQIQNAATHTLWARATNTAGANAYIEVDPLLNGNVLTATA